MSMLIVLILMSALREFMGFGTLLGIQILPDFIPPLTIMILPAGGFLVFAVFMALTYFIENKNISLREKISFSNE